MELEIELITLYIIFQFSITTNPETLKLHLKLHNLTFKRSKRKQKALETVFIPFNSKSSETGTNKTIIGQRLIKMFVLDNLPFSTVEKKGFRNFCLETGVVKDLSELPTEANLRLNTLDDCYQFLKEKIVLITSKIEFAGLQADAWTDNFARNPYLGIIINFINDEWKQEKILLRCPELPHPQTGAAIKDMLEKTLKEFNIDKKKIVGVTDNGANIKSAFRLMKVDRMSCVGHNMHLLLQTDGCDKVIEVAEVIKTLKKIHLAIIYRKHEMMAGEITKKQKSMIDKIISMGR